MLKQPSLFTKKEVMEDLIKEVTNDLLSSVGKETMDNFGAIKKLEQQLKEAESVGLDICHEVVKEEMVKICKEGLELAEKEREMQVQDLLMKRQKRIIKAAFSSWQAVAAKKKRARATLENFPSEPTHLSLAEQNSKLAMYQDCGHSLKEVHRLHNQTGLMLRAVDLADELLERLVLDSFDLNRLVFPGSGREEERRTHHVEAPLGPARHARRLRLQDGS